MKLSNFLLSLSPGDIRDYIKTNENEKYKSSQFFADIDFS